MFKKALVTLGGILVALGGALGYTEYKTEQTTEELEKSVHMVTRVIDGDTIGIGDARVRVRLLGIDAPEKGDCWYEESREALGELLDGVLVRLEKDISGEDDYSRLLRYVIKVAPDREDNVLVNEYQLKEGHARTLSTSPDVKYRDLFASAQEEARRAGLGLWGACQSEEDKKLLRQSDELPPNDECTIKGNISEKGYGKTYVVEGCDNYERVKIDYSKGEQYFCSEEEAVEAGFRRATNCP